MNRVTFVLCLVCSVPLVRAQRQVFALIPIDPSNSNPGAAKPNLPVINPNPIVGAGPGPNVTTNVQTPAPLPNVAPVQTPNIAPAPVQTPNIAPAPVQTPNVAPAPVQTPIVAPAPVQTPEVISVQTANITGAEPVPTGQILHTTTVAQTPIVVQAATLPPVAPIQTVIAARISTATPIIEANTAPANPQGPALKGNYVKTSAVPKPCEHHSDCYDLREPDEWCPLGPNEKYSDKGCFCDFTRKTCAFQRLGVKGPEYSDCTLKVESNCSGLGSGRGNTTLSRQRQ